MILADGNGEKAIIDSLHAFKAAGGGCIVENTTYGLFRDAEFMKSAARETGVSIVAGTGYYREFACRKLTNFDSLTAETMTFQIIKDLNNGLNDDPDLKCGFIGEVGISETLTSKTLIDNNQDEICHATSNSFHG